MGYEHKDKLVALVWGVVWQYTSISSLESHGLEFTDRGTRLDLVESLCVSGADKLLPPPKNDGPMTRAFDRPPFCGTPGLTKTPCPLCVDCAEIRFACPGEQLILRFDGPARRVASLHLEGQA